MFGNLFNQPKPNDSGQVAPPPQIPQQPYVQGAYYGPVQPMYPQQFQNPFVGQVPQMPPQVPMQPVPTQSGITQDPVVAPDAAPSIDDDKKGSVSALSRLDPRSTQVINEATNSAKSHKQQQIELDDILLGLTKDKDIAKLFQEFKLDPAKIQSDLVGKMQTGTFEGQPQLSEATKALLEKAFRDAKAREAGFIAPEDILLAMFDTAENEFLATQGVDKGKFEEKLSKDAEFALGRHSVLDKFGIDLTAEASQGKLDPITGRDKEILRMIHILLRRTKNNPILIGEAGTGKTAIVEGVAQQIVSGNVPEQMKGKRIIQLDLSSLIAGASHRGEFEDRLRNVIKEVQVADGQIILFVDEIHTIIGAGDSGGALDASNIVKPYLARGQLQLIGTTTTTEYRKYFEKDKAFQRRFQPVLVEEPSEEVAIKMLEVIKPKYEKFHNVVYTKEALEASVALSKKYVGERYLPDKAVDLLDEAGSEVKLLVSQGQKKDNQVRREDIEKIISAWTGIPITKLTEDESQKLLQLEDLIHKRLIDQEEAVAAVAEAVRRGRIGLSSAKRPIASFIFLGPTGVGKTELAKTLAEIMFGRDDATIRLDMSEYMEKHEVAKLIGAPPGYVGYEEGGQLTEAVRNKPYSIVLLDEVEKAHPDVFNILLQLLEDGRLTDNKGNTVSFKNTIIIATSNIGSSVIQKYLLTKVEEQKKAAQGQVPQPVPANGAPKAAEHMEQDLASDGEVNYEELTSLITEELHKFFKPELLNRFDDIVLFKPLARRDMVKIAQLGIQKTRELVQEQGYDMQITQRALDQLAKEGYDPIYGARPLRRLIQTAIENPLAVFLISKKVQKGDNIIIDYDPQKMEYTFTKAQPQTGTAPTGQQPGEAPQQSGAQPTQPPPQPLTPQMPPQMPQPQAPQMPQASGGQQMQPAPNQSGPLPQAQ